MERTRRTGPFLLIRPGRTELALRLRLLVVTDRRRYALAEGVALVLVRAVLVAERGGVRGALGLALLRGVHDRVSVLGLQLAHLCLYAVAQGLLFGALAVSNLRLGGLRRGLALLDGLGVN